MAYYSLTIDGIYLPGERPWRPRWEQLRGATSLRGKRVLELGCNMALFSSFAIAEESAACAMAVDADARILKAAALVTRACNAQVELVCQDFDEQGWEDRLASFRPDVVTALSVVQWVADKDRFLQFLGRFPELLYEGHDPVDIERARLLGAGFDRVELIGESERSRPLLRATRKLD
jgi:ubiquinone/menaquinone biosynthesis C-methylase UbiE